LVEATQSAPHAHWSAPARRGCYESERSRLHTSVEEHDDSSKLEKPCRQGAINELKSPRLAGKQLSMET